MDIIEELIKNPDIKVRTLPENNYRGIWYKGQTIRIALDPSKPITELNYPEFYDIKITDKCDGNCPYCYMDSTSDSIHYENIISKLYSLFINMTKDQKPFQIAYGGGNPNQHPDFIGLLKATIDLGIIPNYTTNGMGITLPILEATSEYCGGVAVSAHKHLSSIWQKAVSTFVDRDIRTNIHYIISDKESVDDFIEVYEKYSGMVDYFVMLKYADIGRAETISVATQYFFDKISELESPEDIAYGAHFFDDIKSRHLPVSLYEPESMSKYIDFKDMKMYPSSFHTKCINYPWIK